ncbi:MAG: 30S ribosomal protein S11 [Candidatus Colwellbacteria bacterium RIFCSPHIGHO2_12_FULL_43_12]|uniref:Small ribosomal subunit protein uS11 n=3 Tax=Candidatus Colwelliibacteriota TaxID=1817904 RepID=A0A1G1YY28_9BACT|nr:MAG: 30S ribosomal protein S11 [Candidatus Colwellbacteria bacterium RIFCSPHIGHO2_02_FULL_43_15]OGY59016.1 MAG: 30S ribosomal protein S11 [Candidatus Colwellbacteria bacterium RIFCSPHIGHO2_12_FULL_43_12]OGY60748.1 MAG: 30S ribosomal protein S11 [Candidatus Colwellbacteria bacterium RIFCSPLOWO2_12_FULL_43_11]
MGKKKVINKPEAAKDGTEAKAKPEVSVSKKESRRIESGRIYINASYNNTVITITDIRGNVLAWATAGSLGFAGPKKATPFAASKVVSAIAEKVAKTGPVDIEVVVSGVGPGRDSAIRSLANAGFNILSIKDVTPIPHNGPKPPKTRRI